MNYSELLNKKLLGNPDFIKAREIVSKCSSGKTWLIGGSIYRTIVQDIRLHDFDFIVESLKETLP